MDKIDKIDRIIIQTLQQDARSSLKSISRETNLSIPAVRERIKKLEKLSYIVRFTTLLNHNKLNKNLTCFCMVMLKKHDPKYEELFLSFAKNNQDILECHCIAGEQEYLLKVVTESMQTLEPLLNCLRKDWGVIRSSTYPVLSTIKELPCITY